jgi:cholesterol oxidase
MSTYQLEFTEEMAGWFAFGDHDPEAGSALGRKAGLGLMFHLTIVVDDVDRFVRDPLTLARADGWVESQALGGRLEVEHGDFNLFVVVGPGHRQMHYRLTFRDGTDHPLTLLGRKEVVGGSWRQLWKQTTTLYVRLRQGHVEDDVDGGDIGAAGDDGLVGAGVLVISPRSFARQLTTFRVHGGSFRGRWRAFAAFVRLFVGHLWHVFGWPRARIRRKAA